MRKKKILNWGWKEGRNKAKKRGRKEVKGKVREEAKKSEK